MTEAEPLGQDWPRNDGAQRSEAGPQGFKGAARRAVWVGRHVAPQISERRAHGLQVDSLSPGRVPTGSTETGGGIEEAIGTGFRETQPVDEHRGRVELLHDVCYQ